jgi:hypothetical protein
MSADLEGFLHRYAQVLDAEFAPVTAAEALARVDELGADFALPAWLDECPPSTAGSGAIGPLGAAGRLRIAAVVLAIAAAVAAAIIVGTGLGHRPTPSPGQRPAPARLPRQQTPTEAVVQVAHLFATGQFATLASEVNYGYHDLKDEVSVLEYQWNNATAPFGDYQSTGTPSQVFPQEAVATLGMAHGAVVLRVHLQPNGMVDSIDFSPFGPVPGVPGFFVVP